MFFSPYLLTKRVRTQKEICMSKYNCDLCEDEKFTTVANGEDDFDKVPCPECNYPEENYEQE